MGYIDLPETAPKQLQDIVLRVPFHCYQCIARCLFVISLLLFLIVSHYNGLTNWRPSWTELLCNEGKMIGTCK